VTRTSSPWAGWTLRDEDLLRKAMQPGGSPYPARRGAPNSRDVGEEDASSNHVGESSVGGRAGVGQAAGTRLRLSYGCAQWAVSTALVNTTGTNWHIWRTYAGFGADCAATNGGRLARALHSHAQHEVPLAMHATNTDNCVCVLALACLLCR
jgi:hypothetical protein